MPNLKASIKDNRKSKKRTEENLRMKRRYRNAIKEFQTHLKNEDLESAKKSLSKAYKLVDKAAKTKLLKKQTASRKKSRLTKLLNKTALNVKTT